VGALSVSAKKVRGEGNNESAFFVRKQEQLANRGGVNILPY